MNVKFKLVIVSHALAQKSAWARWQRLAEMFPVQVTLLVPAKWVSYWFDKKTVFNSDLYNLDRFQVIPIETSNESNWCTYYFKSIDANLKKLEPDIIFVIQEPLTNILNQMMFYRLIWARKAKVVFYSYLNIPPNITSLRGKMYSKVHFITIKYLTHLAVCGSFDAVKVLRGMGFTKRIFLQTEIGIDEMVFCPDDSKRDQVRIDLKLDGFVVGYCGRLSPEKGIIDLVQACLNLSWNWRLLCVGDGELKDQIMDILSKANLADRIIITGQIPHNDVQIYLRAMDCMVVPSRTTSTWKEQFGLVIPQAMACKVPVIGSNSGAIPEVIGENGLLFPEGDILALTRHIDKLQSDKSFSTSIAENGLNAAIIKYSASNLAKEIYEEFSRMFL